MASDGNGVDGGGLSCVVVVVVVVAVVIGRVVFSEMIVMYHEDVSNGASHITISKSRM